MSEINYVHNEVTHNTGAASQILPFVFNLIQPKSVLDIGCANGTWLKVCKDLGVEEILGVDGISVDKKYIKDTEFQLHDLRQPLLLNKKFDLVMCLEVAEHLPQEAADNIVSMLTSNSDFILFSAAIPDQGGQFHINEQWPEYWNAKFRANGFLGFDIVREKFWNDDKVEWWYKQNMIFYAKSDRAANLQVEPSKIVRSVVHPELYRKKVFHPRYLKNRGDLFKLLKTFLRYFLKSFWKG